MNLNEFYITGINYKKTDASIRGQFAVNTDQYAAILEEAGQNGVEEMFVLSTCNRTEVFGLAPSPNVLIDLLCKQTSGSADSFKELAYIKQGMAAIEHLFSVGAGLDSQILGDYEIVGQIKQAIKFARENEFVGTFIERLYNTVLQSSKAIKAHTELSSGTVSVSFAAIQFLKQHLPDASHKKIVLLGTGKIGRNTCKNLVDYCGADSNNITLVNRTQAKAEALAQELQVKTAPYSQMMQVVQQADVVIVATNAEEPVICKKDLEGFGAKILIDLSIPNNIEPAAGELPGVALVNVDGLSRINDETLQNRIAEVPKANAIIVQHMQEFLEWYGMRQHVPALKAAKLKLQELHECGLFTLAAEAENTPATGGCPFHHKQPSSEETIQKVINNMALKMRRQQLPGCSYIEAINDFISAGNMN
ncbi:glutamyl-tRNA reductase [Filimonas lacunae]|uniref:Glutamyl-tRNA reductase n=1 Tax=Filimonas lacunae TaxID=477680 RepID=A0A173MN23_9BACT|nr:glutamyl-tRNA reductase [Filimonas lacunae]BAV09043.1 glutamyl-tRNA reductase [Filimonas lacunae]SIS66328.1 glutamyl-tRNA reductase [Filimonas lacunae]